MPWALPVVHPDSAPKLQFEPVASADELTVAPLVVPGETG